MDNILKAQDETESDVFEMSGKDRLKRLNNLISKENSEREN